MAKQLGFFVNSQRCIWCRTCEMACKDKNDNEKGVRFRRVLIFEGGKYPEPYAYALSLACNHCVKPTCVPVCPVGALEKREKDGIVVYHYDKCIGCRRCEWSCPYGAPQWNAGDKKMKKCDFCHDYIDQGKPPACVASCITRALEFGEMEELEKLPDSDKEAAGFADIKLTKPSIIFRLHPEGKVKKQGEEKVKS